MLHVANIPIYDTIIHILLNFSTYFCVFLGKHKIKNLYNINNNNINNSKCISFQIITFVNIPWSFPSMTYLANMISGKTVVTELTIRVSETIRNIKFAKKLLHFLGIKNIPWISFCLTYGLLGNSFFFFKPNMTPFVSLDN